MDSLRLINYRGLEDTGTVNIKPLTFLLGANSTGKSSFLKILPLLKQSANTNVRGSFLWNGSLVDFEDFQNVVRNGEGDIEMEFCLSDFMYFGQRYWPSDKRIPSLMVRLKLSKLQEIMDVYYNLEGDAQKDAYEKGKKEFKFTIEHLGEDYLRRNFMHMYEELERKTVGVSRKEQLAARINSLQEEMDSLKAEMEGA